MLLLLFVRYLYLILKFKQEALTRQKNVQLTKTKNVFDIFYKINETWNILHGIN